jgi:DNA repair exonuclease SbcCD ATPase subunit
VTCVSFHPERKYTQDQLADVLPEVDLAPVEHKSGTEKGLDQVMRSCVFLQHCRDDASSLSEHELLSEKKEIIENAEIIRKTLCTTESMIAEKQRLEDEILVLVEMTQNLVAENARIAQDQEEYQKRYDSLVQRYEAAKEHYDDLVTKIEQKEAHGERIKQFIKTLKEQQGILTEFEDALWGSMVEYVTIGKEKCSVTFKDGTEITVE